MLWLNIGLLVGWALLIFAWLFVCNKADQRCTKLLRDLDNLQREINR